MALIVKTHVLTELPLAGSGLVNVTNAHMALFFHVFLGPVLLEFGQHSKAFSAQVPPLLFPLITVLFLYLLSYPG